MQHREVAKLLVSTFVLWAPDFRGVCVPRRFGCCLGWARQAHILAEILPDDEFYGLMHSKITPPSLKDLVLFG